jgi:hypothetical protein
VGKMESAFIAFSYHYDSDIGFVRTLARILENRRIPCWYLETLGQEQRSCLGLGYNWEKDPENWQAIFLEHLLHARGVIVVLSQDAKYSLETGGHGMWRETPAIEFIRKDNPERILEIEVFPIHDENENRLAEIVKWSKRILNLPAVHREPMDGRIAVSFNRPIRPLGKGPGGKYVPSYWCELVRLDLYDVEWCCRRCSLRSDNYEEAYWNPPHSCPRCGYGGEPETDDERENREDLEEFKARPEVQATVTKILERLSDFQEKKKKEIDEHHRNSKN